MNRATAIFLTLGLLFSSGCGVIQKARYYQAGAAEESLASVEWGDGLAAIDGDLCLWVGDRSALYLPMAFGPVGFPWLPLGFLAGKNERAGHFDLSVWLVPRDGEKAGFFKFDPTKTRLEFEDRTKKDPSVIQVSRFKTRWENNREIISHPEHWQAKPGSDYIEPIELWDWSRFVMRFYKSHKFVGPRKVILEGVIATQGDGQKQRYEFTFREVTKHRYLVSGHQPNGVWGIVSEATPCRNLFAERDTPRERETR